MPRRFRVASLDVLSASRANLRRIAYRMRAAVPRLLAIVVLALALARGTLPAQARSRHGPTSAPMATPVPMPSAIPLSQDARMSRMREELTAIARDAPGRLGIAVIDLATNRRISVRGDEAFPLAGTARVAIAIAAYRLADQRKLDLGERITVTRGDLRSGSSDIALAHPQGGASYRFWELVRAMLVSSDGTASDLVLRAVGGPQSVGTLLWRLNVRGFTIRGSQAKLAWQSAGTPDAMAELLAGLATQRFARLDATNEVLLDLDDVATGPKRLRAGLPTTLRLAHEPGTSVTLDGTTEATNDVGLITLPDGRRIAVVALLADSRAEEAARDATLARVARAVAEAYAP